jgi:hypothetical protein
MLHSRHKLEHLERAPYLASFQLAHRIRNQALQAYDLVLEIADLCPLGEEREASSEKRDEREEKREERREKSEERREEKSAEKKREEREEKRENREKREER